jgi:hypothetical protein
MPLVNELVIGFLQKNLLNAVKPTADAALADFVTNPTCPAILNALFLAPVNATLGTSFTNLAPSNLPRNDLVATFLTGIETLNKLKTVTASEMLRLNTGIPVTPQASQKALGVVADDLAGYPNGQRPGDHTVDITLRVAMGRLCHPVPIAGKLTDLGLCKPADAPTGMLAFTDGAPSHASNILNVFHYLNPPLRDAPRPQTQPWIGVSDMTKNTKRIIAICLASAALADCGGSNNTPPAPPVAVTPPAAKLEDQFGAGFGTAFRADPNTEAKDPAPGDVNPVDPTREPITI